LGDKIERHAKDIGECLKPISQVGLHITIAPWDRGQSLSRYCRLVKPGTNRFCLYGRLNQCHAALFGPNTLDA
jgi:hypothetical protein